MSSRIAVLFSIGCPIFCFGYGQSNNGKNNGHHNNGHHGNGHNNNGHHNNGNHGGPNGGEMSETFVLDDNTIEGQGLKTSTLESCLRDAYNGSFHQGSTVEAYAQYTFDPFESGCYVIEEWHPGTENCAKYMARSVRLDVIYCKANRLAYTYLDQSLNGGRWNALGALTFKKGWSGKITLKNNCPKNCQNGEMCLFAADAFRLTKVKYTLTRSGWRCKLPRDWNENRDASAAQASSVPSTTSSASTTPFIETTVATREASEMSSTVSNRTIQFITTTPSADALVSTTRSVSSTAPLIGNTTTIVAESSSSSGTSLLTTMAVSSAFIDDFGVAETLSSAETLPQTIVDDVEAVAHAAWNMHEMGPNTPQLSCGAQGWKQRFLFLDPAVTKETDAPATFSFDPPQTGCFLVEEFHPANVCDKDLSPLVQVTIEYGENKKAHVTLDQTRFGNRWNSVALLPFRKGAQGRILVNHPQVEKGIAVADAFRFTHVSTSCEEAPLKFVEYARLSQHPISVTIDDERALKQGTSAVSGCEKTALDATIFAAVQGQASASFTFTPPSTGCFRVDEFHPQADETCPLQAEAGVQLDFRSGESWTGSIPLAKNGGQWNVLGHFPFYAGMSTNITSRRLPSSDLWVADAFRFTKVSDQCHRRPHAVLVTIRLVGVDLENSGLPEGQLTTYVDLRLAFHESVTASAEIDDQAVRLIGLRRGSIITEFEIIGDKDTVSDAIARLRADLGNPSGSKLGEKMCAAATAGADVSTPVQCRAELLRVEVVEGLDIDTVPPTSDVSESDTKAIAIVLLVSGGVLALTLLVLVLLLRSRRRRRLSQKESKNIIAAKEVNDKVEKECVSDCGSTATPPSGKISSEVQTDISGDISEIGSLCSRECTVDMKFDETNEEHQALQSVTIVL